MSGVIIGGIIFNKIGGYESPKAYPLCVLIMSIGSTIGFPLPFVTDPNLSALLVWVEFFCGGFCMPALIALQIANVPPSAKTTANSLANFVYNLLGYLPAPYIYGLVYDNTGGGNSIWGMFSL